MNIGCTQMHPVTLVAIIIGLITLGAQSALYLQRTHDRTRLGYIILLVLLIGFNVANGLLPNPAYAMPLYIQHIIVNTAGFIIVSYFPFYFYRVIGLDKLRFLAIYGVPLFLILPYVAFFLVGLTMHGDIAFTHRYGYICSTAYSLALLAAIGRSIRVGYRKQRNLSLFVEELLAYMAIMPWALLAPVVYYGWGQLTETLFTNLGFLALSALLLYRSVTLGRADQRQLANLRLLAMDTEVITANCLRNMLSPRETEIAILLCHRLTRREIADKLFISDRTVEKHTEHIFLKVGVNSRQELLAKLNTPA
ncbi:response regulator transcription factor [Sphingobacterium spiritivorum]|uniref:helix-turn-helix transcriptional regulator n=1 Tax=Sphingobacterium spiritivorum TaxID=258 RepID=UPI003DA4AF61